MSVASEKNIKEYNEEKKETMTTESTNEELVILLDDQGNPTGHAPKSEVHTKNTPLHLAFSCYILNDRGEVLITRRALTKKAWPGVWTNSVCGHPGPGESHEEAVLRRAVEELGLKVDDLSAVIPDFEYRAVDASGIVEWEVCPVFVSRAVGEMAPNLAEVCDHRWVAPVDLFSSIDATPFAFSPWMVEQLSDSRLREVLREGCC